MGTAQAPGACCPFQASPLHSQLQPDVPLGQDRALQHSSAAVVPDPCSALPWSQGEMSCWGCPCSALVSGEHPGTPLIQHGLVNCRLQPAPGHLQDLQPPQGTESPILNAADLVLVQLPVGEKREGALLGQPRQSDQWLLISPVPKNPCAPVPNSTRTHRFLRSVAPRKAFLGMAWMKFSLRSLQKKEAGRKMRSACKA